MGAAQALLPSLVAGGELDSNAIAPSRKVGEGDKALSVDAVYARIFCLRCRL